MYVFDLSNGVNMNRIWKRTVVRINCKVGRVHQKLKTAIQHHYWYQSASACSCARVRWRGAIGQAHVPVIERMRFPNLPFDVAYGVRHMHHTCTRQHK